MAKAPMMSPRLAVIGQGLRQLFLLNALRNGIG
jgi:hypothetical protein